MCMMEGKGPGMQSADGKGKYEGWGLAPVILDLVKGNGKTLSEKNEAMLQRSVSKGYYRNGEAGSSSPGVTVSPAQAQSSSSMFNTGAAGTGAGFVTRR